MPQRRVESWMAGGRSGVLGCDPAANLIGRRPRRTADSRTLLDRLASGQRRNAGRYDGVLGVMLGLALAEILGEAGLKFPFAPGRDRLLRGGRRAVRKRRTSARGRSLAN